LAADVFALREHHAALSAATLKAHRRVESELRDLDDRVAGVNNRLGSLDEDVRPVVAGARAVPWSQEGSFAVVDDPQLGEVLAWASDADALGYAGFEEVFRGTRERVASLLSGYVELLHDHAPVFDVGAGRGELLELLAEAGIGASGVDLDDDMARAARDAGLNVETGDGADALTAQPAGSLGAVTAIHVIEHLSYPELARFLSAAHAALRPGAMLVCETVNPHAPGSLKTFWTDPTHRHPLFPETMIVLAHAAGFDPAVITFPRGTRNVAVDLLQSDAYTLVARVPLPGR